MSQSIVRGAGKRYRGIIAFLVCLAAGCPSVRSQDMPVPVDVQASLLPKILSFERSATQHRGGGGVVGIVYQSQVRSSLVCATEIAEVLPRFLLGADGSPLRCVLIEYVSESDLSRRCTEEGVTMVYVSPLRSVDIGALGRMLQNHRLLSFTGVPSYVEAGLVLGVDVVGNRPKILVNLPVARAIGAEFSSQLLKLSRVIE
jgi:hypothetical protein